MSAAGEQLLSKVVDDGDIHAFTRYGIRREHFATEAERQAYDFIQQYAEEHRAAPSYATLVANTEITYIPGVTDSYEYLTRQLKDAYGKRRIAEVLEDPALADRFQKMSAEDFANLLTDTLDRINIDIRTGVRIGKDIAKDAGEFLAEYEARKAGKSFRIWRSKFPTINEQVGGYLSSNVYTWYARSGRGKSVITMEEAIEAAFQGATVLVWALEMSWFEWMARAYTSISARSGINVAEVNGIEFDAGFDNRALLTGKLSEDFEAALRTFAESLNDILPGRIIVRAVDDPDFRDRSVRQLEADIERFRADVVVIDPIYYMDYEANTSRTAGGDVAATSKKLRHLAGRTKTVLHVITQADEDASEKSANGTRELKPPKRAEIKKTKAVLEDAANVFGIDTLVHEGRGIIEVGKGRSGGEDTRIELLYLPNFGIVQELPTGAEIAEQFESPF